MQLGIYSDEAAVKKVTAIQIEPHEVSLTSSRQVNCLIKGDYKRTVKTNHTHKKQESIMAQSSKKANLKVNQSICSMQLILVYLIPINEEDDGT